MTKSDKPQLNCTLLSSGDKTVNCQRNDEIQDNYSPSNVFVGIPYSEEYRPFEIALRQQLENMLLFPILPKDYSANKNLFCNICYNIHICDYCIFEISNKFTFGGKKQKNFNPNIFYEFGFSQALNKKCLLISYKHGYTSSDLSGFILNVYSDENELKRKIRLWFQDNFSEEDDLWINLIRKAIEEPENMVRIKINKSDDELIEYMKKTIAHLNPIDRELIVNYFGLFDGNKKTYLEIGEKYGMSMSTLRQKIASILRKLRTI